MRAPEKEPADPLLDLITRYRRSCDSYNALPREVEDDMLERIFATTVAPLMQEMEEQIPPAATYAGAIEALRLCVEDLRIGASDIQLPLALAALTYFDGSSK